jgi:hypothetical protein
MPVFPANLTTNEVKNAAGTEVEFLRLGALPGSERSMVFAKSGEVPAQQHRISVSHQESGSGLTARRRSVVRIDQTIAGQVDTTKLVKNSFYLVGDLAIGQLTALTVPTDLLANLVSLIASQGATTTILYDGTGYGASSILNGSL